MRQKMRIAAFLILAFLCAPQAVMAQTPQFFEALYDVPVMPGLREIPGETLLFDKPDGRIASVVAASDSLNSSQVLEFYGQALPQLGWKKIAMNQYVRDGQALLLEITPAGSLMAVHFTLSPAGP